MLPHVTLQAARRFGDETAIVAPDGWTLNYLGLYQLTERTASGLARRGVESGDVVGLVMRSSPDYVVAYLAAARLGAVTAGVNPRLAPDERARILEAADPKLVVAADDLADGVPSDVEAEIVTPATTPDEVLSTLAGTDQASRLRIDRDRPVAIVFTSGTTGEPKGAVFGNRQLAAITMFDCGGRWGSAADASRGSGPMLSATELGHVGFMTKLPWYLRCGYEIHLLRRWRAAEALEIVERHRLPMVGGIPAQIALMLRDPTFDERDLSSVQAIVVGGGHSSPGLIVEARERFEAPYSVRYSSTESGGVGTLTAFDAPDEEALHTVGRPREGIALEIRDTDGRAVPDGEVGEVCLRSPAMMSGYWRNPEGTAEALRDGWLHTGDLGYLDDLGCLRLAGRAKEMYIRGGYNVYPLEVEAVLSTHPDVSEAVVVPRADEVMGEIGVAVVVPRDPDRPPTLAGIRQHCGPHLAAYKLPEAVRIVAALPLTTMNKVDRRALVTEEAGSTIGEPSEPGLS